MRCLSTPGGGYLCGSFRAQRARCSGCGKVRAILLCDHEVGGQCPSCAGTGCYDCNQSGVKNCSAKVCKDCVFTVGERDYCVAHREEHGYVAPPAAAKQVPRPREFKDVVWTRSPYEFWCDRYPCLNVIKKGDRGLFDKRRSEVFCQACGEEVIAELKAAPVTRKESLNAST